MQPAPTRAPANTIAWLETTVPAPISAGGSGSRRAVERGPSAGCLPTTAPSSTRTPSPSTVPSWTTALGWTSAAMERLRQPLERTDDAGALPRDRPPVPVAGDELQERLTLQAERLGVVDPRAEDVT